MDTEKKSALKGHPGLAGTLLVLAAVVVYASIRAYMGRGIPAYVVARSDIVQSVVASGRVETPRRTEIGSQITGTVVSIPVAEGQEVKAGQLLIGLESGEAQAAVVQARAAVNQARARLGQLQNLTLPSAQQALQQARSNLENVQRQYERTKELRSKGFVGQSQLDDARHSVDIAASQLKTAQLQVSTNSPRGSDYRMALTALEQAEANLKMALARLDYTTIEAPSDGILIARSVERGDVVQPGKALMVLSPAGQTQLVLQIDEKNLSSLRIGQQALASADAYADQRFPAELTYINPGVDPQRGTVEVKLTVAEPPAYLRQDMTVSVDIETAHRAAAAVVPAAALHDAGSGAPWVMKMVRNHAIRQAVRTGIRGSGQVEILAGLRPGDIVLSAASDVAAGKRVHAVIVQQNRKAAS